MSKTNNAYRHEEILLAALRARKQDAFDFLYDHYSVALFGVIKRIVQHEELAADVMQDAFVKIWKNIDTYNTDKGSLFTWMLNICRNRAIDETRSRAFRNDSKNQNVEDSVYQVDRATQVFQKTEHIGLKNVVSGLKAEHRVLIDKLYFEGYTQEDVSQELGIPLGTVKTRVRKAMQNLRTILQEK